MDRHLSVVGIDYEADSQRPNPMSSRNKNEFCTRKDMKRYEKMLQTMFYLANLLCTVLLSFFVGCANEQRIICRRASPVRLPMSGKPRQSRGRGRARTNAVFRDMDIMYSIMVNNG